MNRKAEKRDVKNRNAMTDGQCEANYEDGNYTQKSRQREWEGNENLLEKF
jgi:hypothetical protein